MTMILIIQNYLFWHYTVAFGEIWHLFKNFTWFTTHFFSIKKLVRTLFYPWKRITEYRNRRFNLEDFASYIIINILSRLIGFFIRGVTILVGLTILISLTLSTFIFYIFWTLAPACIVVLIYFGLVFLIT